MLFLQTLYPQEVTVLLCAMSNFCSEQLGDDRAEARCSAPMSLSSFSLTSIDLIVLCPGCMSVSAIYLAPLSVMRFPARISCLTGHGLNCSAWQSWSTATSPIMLTLKSSTCMGALVLIKALQSILRPPFPNLLSSRERKGHLRKVRSVGRRSMV